MQAVSTIGFDIAKFIFQVHGVNVKGQVVIRQQLRRARVVGFFKKLSALAINKPIRRTRP